jgi:large conductance mechanosensitive channel
MRKGECNMVDEFRKFIMRGNVIDLAIGIIMGAAFTAVITSLVNDVIMPPIGWAIGGLDFSALAIALPPSPMAAPDAAPVLIKYGAFLNTVLNLMIVGFAVFMLVRGVNAMQERFAKKAAEAPAAPAAPSNEEKLLAEIRDLLAKR